MRGDEERQDSIILFSSLEDRIPSDHPLRGIRRVLTGSLRISVPSLTSSITSGAASSSRLSISCALNWSNTSTPPLPNGGCVSNAA